MGLLQKRKNSTVQCSICERKCKIAEGKFGYCRTRVNQGGKIYTTVYGLIPAISSNPIEKKPLYHFFPGSTAITIGTYGCNFNCFWCQNHHLSHPKEKIYKLADNISQYIGPEEVIKVALQNLCQGTSVSFNEPTLLFEYSLHLFKLAKKEGLYNTYVSNGYMTEDVLYELIDSGLDAMNIDVKGDAKMVKKYCGADNEKVWRNINSAKERGVHVEITTLLLEGFNTDELIIKTIANRIVNELGEETPFHISRAFPYYRSDVHNLTHPTPLNILYKARKIAINEGLKFVYIGNIKSNNYQNTKCPSCSQIVIERNEYSISNTNLDKNGSCKYCGHFISII
jgi:pyruvate formate lyase activating enzyme